MTLLKTVKAMDNLFSFILTNIALGTGLAMDAFSVSLANGLNEPNIKKSKAAGMAGIFALFQAIMPMLGWLCVHTAVQKFEQFSKFIPWIALILLGIIGGKMISDGIKNKGEEVELQKAGLMSILIQAVATSIDALSVGFTIASYDFKEALCSALLIGTVTFFICFAGVLIGKKAGTKISGKAGILGGTILLIIGIEIFVKSFL